MSRSGLIVVTGASGFIGSSLCALLESRHAGRVVRIGRPPQSEAQLQLAAPEHVEACMHLAWHARDADYLNSTENSTSLAFATRVLDAMLARGAKHFIAVGTCLEKLPDDHPLRATAYVTAKSRFRELARAACAASGVAFTWARVFMIYGPGEPERKLASTVVAALQAQRPLRLNQADNSMDMIHVDDVTRALLTIFDRRITGDVDIGTGRRITARTLVDEAACALRRPAPDVGPIRHDPEHFPLADSGALRAAGWEPRLSIADGIRTFINPTKHCEHT